MKLQDFLNDLCHRIHISQKQCLCGDILNKQISDRITKGECVLKHYSHPEGWKVEGFDEKQWLYIKCLKCHVSWSLDKLGVPQSTTESLSRRSNH